MSDISRRCFVVPCNLFAGDVRSSSSASRHGSSRQNAIDEMHSKLPLGSGSQLFGEGKADESKHVTSAQSNTVHLEPGSLKRFNGGPAGTTQSAAKRRRQSHDDHHKHDAIVHSQGVSPTPQAEEDSHASQSQQSSQELAASICPAPASTRKRGAVAASVGPYESRRDSDPLVRETMPPGGRSPRSPQSDLSDQDSVRSYLGACSGIACRAYLYLFAVFDAFLRCRGVRVIFTRDCRRIIAIR